MHDILGVNLMCTFRWDMSFEIFLPYGSILTNTKRKKSKILNFETQNNNKEIIVWRFGG